MTPLDASLAAFRTQGFAPLGRVVDDAALERLRTRAVDLMLGRVVHPGLFFQMDAATGDWRDAPKGLGWQGPSLHYRKLEKLELDEEFRALVRNPTLEPLVRALIPAEVRLYRAIVFNKAAGGGSEVPWHQDGGRMWGLSREPEVQVWTALDDAPEDGGCLEFLPGSHAWGLASPLGGVVDPALVAREAADVKAVAVPARAGESILLHSLVWHRSRRPTNGQRRLAFSACYLPADIHCVRRRGTPRTFFTVFEAPSEGPRRA